MPLVAVCRWAGERYPHWSKHATAQQIFLSTIFIPAQSGRMVKLILLALGGALGTLARYGLNGVISARMATFPLGTMIVNITGCFVIGLLAPLALRPEWRLFLIFGFCGGYTTFSSFGIQSLELARDGEWLAVALNIIGTNVLSLLAVYLGWVCGRALHGGTP
jgi:fluoride exporter